MTKNLLKVSVNYFYQYPFVYSSYYPKEEKQKLYKISIDTLGKNIKKRRFNCKRLHSKRRE